MARWFFLVGGAAGTVAKTISAYDMDVSDAIYGPSGRYVSRQRLEAMLDYECGRLTERLAAKRGDATTFFVFADTVATGSYRHPGPGRGWVGIRFQLRPHDPPSEIIVHVTCSTRRRHSSRRRWACSASTWYTARCTTGQSRRA